MQLVTPFLEIRTYLLKVVSSFPWCILAAALITLVTACSDEGHTSEIKSLPGGMAVPVEVATVSQKTVPVRIPAIGTVEAYATVAVKSRLDSQIMKVYFQEGQEVAKSDLLFDLDARPFVAQLRQAEANLLRDKAQLDYALIQERRYQNLLQKKDVTKDQYDEVHSKRESAEAVVHADEAAIESARLQIEYSSIHSPIQGRMGRLLIQQGNVVKANDTGPLVMINQLTPIYVNFSIPEQYLGSVRRYLAAGTIKVQATVPNTDLPPASGELTLVDNAVDTATGTIKLRATFPNKDKLLWPGQYVNISLTLYEQLAAVVVPSQAVQTGPQGYYVFVVKPDLSAELRDIQVARTEGGDTVIAKGVVPGEQVVTNGQSRLFPGARVNFKTAPGEAS